MPPKAIDMGSSKDGATETSSLDSVSVSSGKTFIDLQSQISIM